MSKYRNNFQKKIAIKFIELFIATPKKKEKIPDIRELISFLGSAKNTGVLLFGDSVSVRFSKDDINKKSLAQLIHDNCKRKNINSFDFTYSAFHPGVFEAVSKVICEESFIGKPVAVLIPVNLRCFSPQWACNPKWQHKEVIASAKSFGRGNRSHPIDDFSEDHGRRSSDWENLLVTYPLIGEKRIAYFNKWVDKKNVSEVDEKERYRNIFIYHYLHKLRSDNERLLSLKSTFATLLEKNIPVVSYICPVNYVAGNAFVGPKFEQLLDDNVRFLKGELNCFLASNNVTFLDFSKEFAPKFFFHEKSPVEHVKIRARKKMAKDISLSLMNLIVKS